MSPEQLEDVLDCGNPQENWQVVIRHWRDRARQSYGIEAELRADAADKLAQADEHHEAGLDFMALANALEAASVTFPASADTRPQGEDATKIAAEFTSGAVPNEDSGDAR